jgi:hypothetical protein
MSEESPFPDPQRLVRLVAAVGTWGENNNDVLGVAELAVGAAILAKCAKVGTQDFSTLLGSFAHFGRPDVDLGATVPRWR